MLLTNVEAAKLLGLKPITLATWRMRKSGPPYVRVGRRAVRYLESDLLAFIATNKVMPGVAHDRTAQG